MKVTYDFRFFADAADEYLPSDLGVTKSVARRVVTNENSSDYVKIAAAVARAEKQDKRFLLGGWKVQRRYLPEELSSSPLVVLSVDLVVEPAGEQCGTVYDEATACSLCGAGARQQGHLFLHPRAFRRSSDFRRTVAGEIVVSTRAAELMRSAGLPPKAFSDVYVVDRRGVSVSDSHVQLLAPGAVVIGDESRFGEHPFDTSACGACVKGDTAGINRLSEVYVVPQPGMEESGVLHSDKFVGVRRGVLRPQRIYLVTQRVYVALLTASVTGCSFERVHYSRS